MLGISDENYGKFCDVEYFTVEKLDWHNNTRHSPLQGCLCIKTVLFVTFLCFQGITAADLKTPSEIKRANAARAAAGDGGYGADSPGRPSTPSFGRRPSGDAPSGSLSSSNNATASGLPDHGQRASSLASAITALRRNSLDPPTAVPVFGSSPVAPPPPAYSPSPFASANYSSAPAPPAPSYSPVPPAAARPPPSPQQYQQGNHNEFAGQPPAQTLFGGHVPPPIRTASMGRPGNSPTPYSQPQNGSGYEQPSSSWATNHQNDGTYIELISPAVSVRRDREKHGIYLSTRNGAMLWTRRFFAPNGGQLKSKYLLRSPAHFPQSILSIDRGKMGNLAEIKLSTMSRV